MAAGEIYVLREAGRLETDAWEGAQEILLQSQTPQALKPMFQNPGGH